MTVNDIYIEAFGNCVGQYVIYDLIFLPVDKEWHSPFGAPYAMEPVSYIWHSREDKGKCIEGLRPEE